MPFIRCLLLALALLLPAGLRAELELHPLFSDHAVLQQGLPVPVWGWAEPKAKVSVTFGEQTGETSAGDDGRWMIVLDPLPASADPASLAVTSGDASVTISDLLVGEVWLCSGQSNMAMTVSRTLDAEPVAASADAGKFAEIRLFKAPVAGADERAERVNATWQTCSPRSVAGFSATGFFFGRALHDARNVPVGLIQSANGGTNAFSWINADTYLNDELAAPTREFWKQTVERFPEANQRYQAALAEWKTKVAAAKAEGKTVEGRAPREPLGPDHVKRPAGHYHAMIAPLQPFAIRGAIWYQGEANSRPPFADHYKDLMFGLVDDWRADWATAGGEKMERRDFPFYLVQLPNFGGGHAQGWPVIREQMLKFWQEGKSTGMVVTIDTGDPADIHPRNKRPVGERLARFARGNVYGEDIVYSGPIYESMTVQGDKAVLKFKHAGGGLASLDDGPLRLFTIAGAEGDFVHATAEIDGDTVVVSNPSIAEPRAVRYAWSNNPENPNLGNREGLPASPFRTDGWDIKLE